MIHQQAKAQREIDWGRLEKQVKSLQFHKVLPKLPVERKGVCGPGSLYGMVSPQGGSVCAGVRLCGMGRVMVLERCRLSFCVSTIEPILRTLNMTN